MQTPAFHLLVPALFICSSAFAGTISQQTAQQIALTFFKLRSTEAGRANETAQLQYQRIEGDGVIDYYVFNMQPAKGFVIVAATDNVTPILAYSTESTFIYEPGAANGVNIWLDNTALKVSRAITGNLRAWGNVPGFWNALLHGEFPVDMKAGDTVGPLLKTTWDQFRRANDSETYDIPYYYNNYCPFIHDSICPAGCNAVAMAQILNYYQCPPHGYSSYTYTNSGSGTLSVTFSDSAYNWKIMPVAITPQNALTDSAAAVESLIFQCAVAVNMILTPTISNSYLVHSNGQPSAKLAYCTYFGYDVANICSYSFADLPDSAAWFNQVKSEIDSNLVVQYRGQNANNSDSHIWVCDGYDNMGDLHMNWGWGGWHNGYYQVGSFNPGTESFNDTEYILIIKPSCETGIGSLNSSVNEMELSPNPVFDWLNVKVTCTVPVAGCPVNIYNALGQMIYTGKQDMGVGKNQFNIPVGNLSSGPYFLRIETKGDYVSGTFLKTE